MSMTLFVIAFLMIYPINHSFAQSVTPENRDWNSFIETEQTNFGMKIKADEAINILNNRMDEIITQMNLSLDSEAQELLEKSQLAWNDYSAANSKFLADTFRGGTHFGLAYSYNMIDEQIKRIKQLLEMNKYRNNI
ncbi:hypothetical protein GM3708_1586 [Geminocystis sp. NIES-3708]|nr:hypothetical protein GM3708_1586 [Geminocystis sp. NIES-3708]